MAVVSKSSWIRFNMRADILDRLQAWRREKRACALVTHISSGMSALVDQTTQCGELSLSDSEVELVRARIAADQSGMLESGHFVRVYAPPLRMIVIGAVHIAKALVPAAALAGFEVIVIDPREAFVRSEQMKDVTAIVGWPDEAMDQLKPDSRTAVVTLTHDPKIDDPALSSALRSKAFYIGALGSRKTHAKRAERLLAAGFSPDEVGRIHGPVGLDINALTPAEIAISIVAQAISILRAEAE